MKQEEEEEEDGEMGIFCNLSKMKLMPFILIIDGTST